MSIINILTCLGGIALFLFGMTYMGDALKKMAGNQMRNFLAKITSNPMKGFLAGLVVTLAIQSSTATNVMALSFVNSGMMSLLQSVPLMTGANLGTTITAWLISLSSIDGASILIQLIKPTSFTPILAFIGIILYRFTKKDKQNNIGALLLGFAILMFGMSTMSSAMTALSSTAVFQKMFSVMSNPILGLVIGVILAAVMQSSSASIGVIQALSLAGALTFRSVIPVVFGINIGQVLPVIIAAAGTTKDARRAAIIDLYLNLFPAIVALPVYMVLCSSGHFPFADYLASPVTIAITHTGYKLLSSVVELPLYRQFERLGHLTFKELPSESDSLFDSRLLATPPLAIMQCRAVMAKEFIQVNDSFDKTVTLFTKWDSEVADDIHKTEQMTDMYQDEVDDYLARLTPKNMTPSDSADQGRLMQYAAALENIGDHIYNIAGCLGRLNEAGKTLNQQSVEALLGLSDKMKVLLKTSASNFAANNEDTAFRIVFMERDIVNTCDRLRGEFLTRLKSGMSTIAVGSIFSDILQDMERISDHLSKQARITIASIHDIKGADAKKYVAALIDNKIREYEQLS